jgi:predicted HTH domain antitoxin
MQVAAADTDTARDRLRAQVRHEQELATRVLAAEARLTTEIEKRDAVLRTHERLIAQRKDELADALTAYIDEAGVSLERAAIVFGRSRSQLQRILRERKIARNAESGFNPHG